MNGSASAHAAPWIMFAMLAGACSGGPSPDSPRSKQPTTDAPQPSVEPSLAPSFAAASSSAATSTAATTPRDASSPSSNTRSTEPATSEPPTPESSLIAGAWAQYEVVDEPQALPHITGLRLSLPPSDPRWFQMEVLQGSARLYAVALRVASLKFLSVERDPVQVDRYVLFPRQGRPIDYRNDQSARALLPKIDIFAHLLPHAETNGPGESAFFDRGIYLGRRIRKIDEGIGANVLPVNEAVRLDLDPDFLIGTSRPFKDDGTGIHPEDGGRFRQGPNDYRYSVLTAQDYRAQIEAGMNLFRVPASHVPHVLEEPVFFHLFSGFEAHPELLYRSNYLGAVMYMDEPGWRILHEKSAASLSDPRAAARLLVTLTSERYEGAGVYGQRCMNRVLTEAGFDFGSELLQPDYPVWEALASAAWYEYEAGVRAFCYQGRFQPRRFAALIREKLGVDFPDDPDSCLRFHYALFTGAARRFAAQWGISIYGQMDADTADRAFPLAYDFGSTYFWLWTSGRGHHVPQARQLELVRAFRRYIKEHPRRAPAAKLSAEARTAIAFPWGYLCDDHTLGRFPGSAEAKLWGSDAMELEDRNSTGVRYRDVIAAGLEIAGEELRRGNRFDIVFLHPNERLPGYERVYRVLETGDVVSE